jgi:hypothetical protein
MMLYRLGGTGVKSHCNGLCQEKKARRDGISDRPGSGRSLGITRRVSASAKPACPTKLKDAEPRFTKKNRYCPGSAVGSAHSEL